MTGWPAITGWTRSGPTCSSRPAMWSRRGRPTCWPPAARPAWPNSGTSVIARPGWPGHNPRVRFSAPLLLAGKTATGFQVPDEVVAALGQGKRPPVRVSINGYTYRNTVAVMGGRYLVGVSAEHRAGAGVAAGDVLDIELELDPEPRSVTVPPDLAAALAAEPAAKK